MLEVVAWLSLILKAQISYSIIKERHYILRYESTFFCPASDRATATSYSYVQD
jgi:hypothetical protein